MERRAVKRSVIISAHAADIWKAITDPDTIKQFLFGVDVQSDWKEKTPIVFSGTWKGKEYNDKGTILKFDKDKTLEYTQSSCLWMNDIPESDFSIIYELEERENDTVLSVTQAGCISADSYDHSAQYWESVLQKLKEIVEKEVVANQVVS